MGLSLCTVGYLAVSLVSTHRMLGSPPVAWRGDLEAVHWVWPPGVGRTGLGGLGSCWVPGTKALKENRWEGPRVEGFGMNPRALLPVLTPPASLCPSLWQPQTMAFCQLSPQVLSVPILPRSLP